MLTEHCGTWEIAKLPPDLAGGDVHVWCTSTDRPAEVVRGMAEIISSDEQGRAHRFRFERDRNRFIVARAVLREILGWCISRDPRQLSFAYGRFGKPALACGSEVGHVQFNVSHSENRALFAVAVGRKVGVDLEFIRPIDDLSLLAERCFSARVNAELQTLPADKRLRDFFEYWTRTEAVQKAIGHGLSSLPDDFDVSIFSSEDPCQVSIPGNPQERDRWSLIGLDPHPDFAAALAVEGRNWLLHKFYWPL